MRNNYVLFGSSIMASLVMSKICKPLDIMYALDNNSEKHGKDIVFKGRSCKIEPPDILINEDLENTQIIVGTSYKNEVMAQVSEIAQKKGLTCKVKAMHVTEMCTDLVEIFYFNKNDANICEIKHTFNIFCEKYVFFELFHKSCNVILSEMKFINDKNESVEIDIKDIVETNGEWRDENLIFFKSAKPYITIYNKYGLKDIYLKLIIEEVFNEKSVSFYKECLSKLIDSGAKLGANYVHDCEMPPITGNKHAVKPIAFYLPQFHSIEENDKWWGKGFTEWTNVTKTYPLFENHYQPHLPADLGFYDLENINIHKKQIAMAKKYGIHGFCYYYYNFSGKTILEMPLLRHLTDKQLDFPFCIFWANADWTKSWTGNSEEVILSIKYSRENDLRLIKDMSKYLKDERYIRVDNKPIIIVYFPEKMPNPFETTNIWRDFCRKEGIGEILLLAVKKFVQPDPLDMGFDGIIDFLPVGILPYSVRINHKMSFYTNDYEGTIIDYTDIVRNKRYFRGDETGIVYKTAFPSWDNTPRFGKKSLTFHGATPELYKRWLMDIINFTKNTHKSNEKFIFINAWNEWAEGAHLEPDRQYGFAYLKATAEALLESLE